MDPLSTHAAELSPRGARVSLARVTTCLYLHHLAPFPRPPASSLLVIPQPDTPTLLQPAPDPDAEPYRPSAEQTATIMATQFSFSSQQDRWCEALGDAPYWNGLDDFSLCFRDRKSVV